MHETTIIDLQNGTEPFAKIVGSLDLHNLEMTNLGNHSAMQVEACQDAMNGCGEDIDACRAYGNCG